MQKIQQTLNSREVAEMIDKSHKNLLKDIRRYSQQLAEVNIDLGEFFSESIYVDANNQARPCFNLTKKGCEFIAHKLTGLKGTIFTARYINRFHEMENILYEERNTELPWFIRKLEGKFIILERDFILITSINMDEYKMLWKKAQFVAGFDFNGYGWNGSNEEFAKKYGFEYGDESPMMYFYPRGVLKALRELESIRQIHIEESIYKMLREGIGKITKQMPVNKELDGRNKFQILKRDLPLQINIQIIEK